MPAIFVGSGNPIHALLRNEYTIGWATPDERQVSYG
jgi:hypothetical protein